MAQFSRNTSETTSPAEAFIQLWGDMGPHWGVPRTLTLVHALLFIEGRALNTDDVMTRLSISRGNASMTLRTLVEWDLATRTHNPADRKDYFASGQDLWQLFVTVARARKRREVEPLMGALQALVDQAGHGDAKHPCRDRLQEMLQFTRTFDVLAERLLAMGPDALQALGASLQDR